jgi:tagatose-1,6-bisphosphate aldolase non-catalytic subunit AgaZ/GatZ
VARRLAAAERLSSVEAELEDAMTRRTELWHEQSVNPDPQIAADVKALSDRINRLWAEARSRRACVRAGSRERILSRVRAEARFEREVKKVQGGAR